VIVGEQKGLKSVTYNNVTGGKIEEVSNVTGIHSVGNGGICGEESTTGKYVGNNLVELIGGTVEWVKE
jgi:hypothetical protein